MSNTFGKQSLKNLEQVDADLVRVAYQVLQVFDHSIICGHRGEAKQTEAFNAGQSKTPWPKSKHNQLPSLAIDFLPYPFDGYPNMDDGIVKYAKDTARFYAISAAYIAVGHSLGVSLRGGFDWDKDGLFTDQKFDDIGHIERD